MALMLSTTGCDFGSDTKNTGVTDTTVSGKAVDGYLRGAAVCLDLDANDICSSFEPNTFTGLDGTYSFTVTVAHKEHPGFADANLIVFGGEDSDTGKNFTGKLVSSFDVTNPTDVFITPLSTMVAAVVEADGNLTKAEAQEKVASLLGLTQEQLTSDPVAAAIAGDTDVLSKALELHKAVEVLAATSTADSKESTANVYLALAEGSLNSSTTTVVDMLNNVDTTTLGADATAVLQAAVVLAQNVALAVTNMETDATDTSLAIAAVANTVDNVKLLLDAEVEAYTGGTYTTAVTTSAATDEANVVTSVTVNNIIVQNVVNNTVTVTLTDAQVAAIIAAIAEGTDITLDSVNDAIIAASDANSTLATEFATLEAEITAQVEQEAVQQALLDTLDTSATTESVLTGDGSFYMDYSWSSDAIIPQMFKVENGAFVNYELNTSTDLFEIVTDTYTDYAYKYIELVNGSWVLKTDTNNTPSFDTNGDLIITSDSDSAKYSMSVFDASGMSINSVVNTDPISEYWMNGALDGNFSSGANYYKILLTEEANRTQDYYQLWYYDNVYDYATQEYISSGINQNYERGTGGVMITTLTEFISEHAYGKQSIDFYSENGSYSGYLAANGVLEMYDYNSAVDVVDGTWKIDTVNGAEILVVEQPLIARDEWMKENNVYTIYAVQDGAVRQGEVNYPSENSESYEVIHYNETAIREIYTALQNANSSTATDPETYSTGTITGVTDSTATDSTATDSTATDSTSSAYNITDIVGTTFYTIDDSYGYSYEVFTPSDFTVGEIDDNPNDKYYDLIDGVWVEDTSIYVDDSVYTYSLSADSTILTVTFSDEISGESGTVVLTITSKTTDYWVIKYSFKYSDSSGTVFTDAFEDTWYLSPTAEMLDPSLLSTATTTAASARVANTLDKVKRKILNSLK